MVKLKGTEVIKEIISKLKGFESFMNDNRKDFGKAGHISFTDYKEVLQEWQYSSDNDMNLAEQAQLNEDTFVLAVLREFEKYEKRKKLHK